MFHAMSRRKTAPLASPFPAPHPAHHGSSMGQFVFMVELSLWSQGSWDGSGTCAHQNAEQRIYRPVETAAYGSLSFNLFSTRLSIEEGPGLESSENLPCRDVVRVDLVLVGSDVEDKNDVLQFVR